MSEMDQLKSFRDAVAGIPGMKHVGHAYAFEGGEPLVLCPGPPHLRTNPDGSCAVCGTHTDGVPNDG